MFYHFELLTFYANHKIMMLILEYFMSEVVPALPRPLEDEPGLMIQMFMVPSTTDSVRILRMFSNA